jgi:16S rRNA (guanine1207-N2)-methyltransferase
MGTPNPGRAGEHYFEAQPAVASERRTIRLHLPDLTLDLVTDRGVFSGDRVDPGTKLLLAEVPVPAGLAGDVLDLGCGYGPIAVTLARRAPAATVWALDVNERARDLAAANAVAAGVGDRVRVVGGDGVPADVRFSAIWSNPPIRIGKTALHELLETWLGRLAPDGQAWLVVQKHLGSDSLAAWLQGRGFAVERRSSRMGYRILSVRPA